MMCHLTKRRERVKFISTIVRKEQVMIKFIKGLLREMFFTPADESEDMSRSVTHKRPGTTTEPPRSRKQ